MKLALAALSLLAAPLAAQAPVKIDLNTQVVGLDSKPRGLGVDSYIPYGGGSSGARMIEFGGDLYFTANLPGLGRELWRTDGTPAGTSLVADLWPGPAGGMEAGTESTAAVVGGRLFFVGEDGSHGLELHTTQGTSATTGMVQDLVPGPGDSGIGLLMPFGGRVLFKAALSAAGDSLMSSDGTAAGTFEVRGPGVMGEVIRELVPDPTGQGVYLWTWDEAGNIGQLWWSDGTSGGTILLNSSSSTQHPGIVGSGSRVLFTGYAPEHGWEPYISDGTPAGTHLLADIHSGSWNSLPLLDPAGEQGAEFYFSAWTLAEGRELYRTDGTAVGTTLVTDASPGWVGSNPVVLGRVGGSLLLSADVQGPSGGVGQELYRLDASGLVLVQDLLPGPAVGMPHSSSPRAPVQIGSDLLFVTSNDHDAETLWRTDGTASGTTELLVNEGKGASWEVYPAPTPTNWGGVFFVADAESTGQELYVSDGTVHGTGLAIDLNPATEGVSSSPVLLGVLDGDDLIVATTKGPERIVRWSEGEGLEVLVEGGLKGWGGLRSYWLEDHEVALIGVGPGGALLQTDGTAAGTKPFGAFPAGMSDAMPWGSDGIKVYVRVERSGLPDSLWTSDGTVMGTKHVVDLPGSVGWLEPGGTMLDGVLLYLAYDAGTASWSLWRSDGTATGTTQLHPIPSLLFPGDLKPAGDRLFFEAGGTAHNGDVWVTDGTSAGTFSLTAGLAGWDPALVARFLGSFAGTLYLQNGSSLWTTNGTPAGTIPVSGVLLDHETHLAELGSGFVYTYSDGIHGAEPWFFDGQSSQLLADLHVGPGHSYPMEYTSCGDRVYFSAQTPATSAEVFVTDGTTTGTHVAFEVVPGPGPGISGWLNFSQTFLLGGGHLYFVGRDDHDFELYSYALPDAHGLELGFSGSGASLAATPPELGGTLTLIVDDAPAGTTGVLAMSAPVADPLDAFVEPGNALWIDPFAFTVLTASTAPTFTHTQPIPNDPALAGAQVNVQAWFLPLALLPATTSNGLRLVLGS